jgi:hypothetical protein
MAEISYPVLNQPMSETLWRVMARAFGIGVLDSGGNPYRVVSRTDATNAIVIGRDTVTGTSEAILNGFVHRIDTDKTLTVPTAAATYEIGLVYDPAGHGTSAGPITLAIWTAPGDYTNNRQRLPLWRLVRAASQALTAATLTDVRLRARATTEAASDAHKPRADQFPVGTDLVAVDTNKRYRAAGANWVELPGNDPRPEELGYAHVGMVPGTLVLRSSDTGIVRFNTAGADEHDGINRGYLNSRLSNYALSSHSHSWASITSKPSTFPPSGHQHNGESITSGTVPWERISGSTRAYSETSGGSTWATVAVSSGGKFFRYTSARKYKTNIGPLTEDLVDPVRALAIEPVVFDRVDNGLKGYWGVIADDHVEHFSNLVQFSEDGEVEGWHYELWTVVQQVVLRYLDARLKTVERELADERTARKAIEKRLAAIESALGLGADG